MAGLMRSLCAGCVVVLVAALGSTASAAEKLGVLIIDGQHNHAWQQTTPAVKKLLTDTGRFTVDVVTTPAARDPKERWDAFRPEFSKYDVILLNYAGQAWPEEIRRALQKYMENGGGLAVYHAAVFGWSDWTAFNQWIGLGWRQPNYGDRITLTDDGTVVRTPRGQGPGSGHGPAHEFEVVTRIADHPIMKGMPAKWKQVKDELYHGQRGPGQNMTILASAFSSKEGKGTGEHEPLVWTIPVGKGRSFVTLLGHDVPATVNPLAATILIRGVEWAATGEVTLPVSR